MGSHEHITRYTAAPNKFDLQPKGTLCVVIKNDEGTAQEYYIQTGNDEDPVWLSASQLLLDIHKNELQDPIFIQNLLHKYQASLDVTPERP